MTEEGNDHVPAAVLARSAAADEMVKSLNANAGQDPATPQQANPDTGAASPAQVNPQQDTDRSNPEQSVQTHEQWQARYNTLKGKYDAEVPRLRAQITQYVGEIDRLKSVLQTRTAQSDTGHQPGAATPDTGRQPGDVTGNKPTASFDPEKFSDYGDDFVQLVQEVNRLKTENNQLKGAVNQVESSQIANTYKEFRSQLAARVPDLEALNSDPKFLEYLGQIHPISGQPLIESLRKAEKDLDVERAVYFFNQYKNSLGNQPNTQQQTRKPPIAPNQGRTATELPSAGKLWTRKEIKAFYADKISGAFTGRDDVADKIERDIFAAQGQGRIVG